jgi:hypothetical protein
MLSLFGQRNRQSKSDVKTAHRRCRHRSYKSNANGANRRSRPHSDRSTPCYDSRSSAREHRVRQILRPVRFARDGFLLALNAASCPFVLLSAFSPEFHADFRAVSAGHGVFGIPVCGSGCVVPKSVELCLASGRVFFLIRVLIWQFLRAFGAGAYSWREFVLGREAVVTTGSESWLPAAVMAPATESVAREKHRLCCKALLYDVDLSRAVTISYLFGQR